MYSYKLVSVQCIESAHSIHIYIYILVYHAYTHHVVFTSAKFPLSAASGQAGDGWVGAGPPPLSALAQRAS